MESFRNLIIACLLLIGCGGSEGGPGICQSNLGNYTGCFIYQDIYTQTDNIRQIIQQGFKFVIINYDTYDGNVPIEHQDDLINKALASGLDVYVGLDQQYKTYWEEPDFFSNQDWVEHQKRYIDWIYSKFGNNVQAIYIAEEVNLCHPFKHYWEYVNQVSKYAHQLGYKVVISPYLTGCNSATIPDMDVDFIFVQDGVGVGNRNVKQAMIMLDNLKKQNPKVFPNIESFVGIYNIQPASKERIIDQIFNEGNLFNNVYVVYNCDTYIRSVR